MVATFFELLAGEALPINLPEGVFFVGVLSGIDGETGQVPTINEQGSVVWSTPGDIPGSSIELEAHAASHEIGGDDILELDRIFGQAEKPQLPSSVAYEDEANVFALGQEFSLDARIEGTLRLNTVDIEQLVHFMT